MLLRPSLCYLSGLLLSGLVSAALANESLKQQPPLEIPKSLNDLDLSPPVDNVKSTPSKSSPPKSEKREVKSVALPAAKPVPARDLSGLPEAGSYTAKAGDTVDKVLQKFYPNSPLRADVLRDALVQNNPKAFVKGNSKQLIPGTILSLPDAVELAKKWLPASQAASNEPVKVTPIGNPAQSASLVSTPAVPAGGGGAVAHSSGHNVQSQDVKRNWVRYP